MSVKPIRKQWGTVWCWCDSSASHNCQTSSTLKTGVADGKWSTILPLHDLFYTSVSSETESGALLRRVFSFFLTFPQLPQLFFSLKMESLISFQRMVDFFFSTQEQEGMSERCKILVCPYIPANLKISKTGFSPKYNGTNPISESHIYWRSLFWVSTVTKKAKFDKKTKQNSDWQLTTRWQRPCFLNTFESPAKARAAIRSFSDYWCANLPPRWLRLCWRSHRVHQQTQRNGCTNTPTYTYLPTPIILAWQTQRKK